MGAVAVAVAVSLLSYVNDPPPPTAITKSTVEVPAPKRVRTGGHDRDHPEHADRDAGRHEPSRFRKAKPESETN
jgi:hypothetical protein